MKFVHLRIGKNKYIMHIDNYYKTLTVLPIYSDFWYCLVALYQ